LTFSLLLSQSFYDISWDGQTYHQEAIIQLANGWNPFHQQHSPDKVSDIWVAHYAKSTWIYAAALYEVTHSIEASKAFNILFIISSFFLGTAALIHFPRISLSQALVLSFLLAFNPVSIYQSLTFYVDGQQSSLLVSLLSISYLWIVRAEYFNVLAFTYLANICVLANIKFTGLVYASIFLFALIIWLLIQRNPQLTIKVAFLGSFSLLLGVVFIGYNPYITNTIYNGHPFYPLAGNNKLDIISTNIPQNFIDKNRLEKLFLSTFSQSSNKFTFSNSSNKYLPESSKLKLPFTLQNEEELKSLSEYDLRVGGFGSLFSGAIILSLIVCLISINIDLSKTKIALLVMSFLMASVLINPEPWWARYVPQFWMLPLMASILALSLKNRILKVLGYGIIIVLTANIFLVSSNYLDKNLKMTQAIEQQLRTISSTKQPLVVSFAGDFRSNRIRFAEWGIKFREVKDLKELPCKAEPLIGSQTLFCVSTNYP
jgi:hypothetical protein